MKPFAVSERAYLEEHKDPRYDYIATGAFVFDFKEPSETRILLLQRAASDSMANRWEVPGGGCQDEDDSVLTAAARELWEEAGLKTQNITQLVGDPYLFSTRSGKRICKFNFLIEARKDSTGHLEVKLNPQEHQNFVWATEKEIMAKRCGDVALEFTTQHQENSLSEAFKQVAQAI